MILSGGGNTLRLSDTWRLSFSPSVAWSSLPALSVSGTPLRRSGITRCSIPLRTRSSSATGSISSGYAASDHALSLANPTAWTMQKFAPSGGTTPAVALDAPDARMLVFEGFGTWRFRSSTSRRGRPSSTSGTLPPLRAPAGSTITIATV
jgi:hypothetical protein